MLPWPQAAGNSGTGAFPWGKLIPWKQNLPHRRGQQEGFSLLREKKNAAGSTSKLSPNVTLARGSPRLPFGDPFPVPGLEQKPAAFAALPGVGGVPHTALAVWGQLAALMARPQCPSLSLAVFQVTPVPEPDIGRFFLPGTLLKSLLLPSLPRRTSARRTRCVPFPHAFCSGARGV